MQDRNISDTALAANGQGHSSDRLARQLIRHLGIAGATRTCRENHWDGVLIAVEAHARSVAQS
jgi:hypothetical protein